MPARLKPRAGITRMSAQAREEEIRLQNAETVRRQKQMAEEAAFEEARHHARYGSGRHADGRGRGRPEVASGRVMAPPTEVQMMRGGRGGFMGQSDRERERERERARARDRGIVVGGELEVQEEGTSRWGEAGQQRTKVEADGPSSSVSGARGDSTSARVRGTKRGASAVASSSADSGLHRAGKRTKRVPVAYDDDDDDIAMLGLPPQERYKQEEEPEDSEDPASDEYDERTHGVPVDIDAIDISSDSDQEEAIEVSGSRAGGGGLRTTSIPKEDEKIEKKTRSPSIRPRHSRPVPANLFPVRLKRQEHVDRKIGLNTESSAATAVGAKHAAAVDEVVVESDEDPSSPAAATAKPDRSLKGKGKARAASNDTHNRTTAAKKTKPDPASTHNDADAHADDATAQAPDISNIDLHHSSTTVNNDTTTNDDHVEPPSIRPSHARKQPLFQTPEERQEHAINAQCTAALLKELDQIHGPQSPSIHTITDTKSALKGRGKGKGKATNGTTDGDLDMAGDDLVDDPSLRRRREHIRERDQSSYIFQFPPLLPDLVPKRNRAPLSHKNQEDQEEQEEQKTTSKQSAAPQAHLHDPTNPIITPGHVGKLRVHASGRTTLDWGGTKMQLGMGMNVEFLQTAVWVRMVPTAGADDDGDGDGDVEMRDAELDAEADVGAGAQAGRSRDHNGKVKKEGHGGDIGGGSSVRTNAKAKRKSKGAYHGEAVSVGSIRGKFVVTPDLREVFKRGRGAR